jgi:aminopeptidase N
LCYREALVIYDNETDNVAQKMDVARTISRAMVRQSIDNAISPSWWSHAWLNEGLAILFHANVLSEVVPHYSRKLE